MKHIATAVIALGLLGVPSSSVAVPGLTSQFVSESSLEDLR